MLVQLAEVAGKKAVRALFDDRGDIKMFIFVYSPSTARDGWSLNSNRNTLAYAIIPLLKREHRSSVMV
jgi:hypothetical protein